MEGGIHVIMMVFYMRYFHYLRSHDNIGQAYPKAPRRLDVKRDMPRRGEVIWLTITDKCVHVPFSS